jgi:ketosteroid isomerase-like protein
MAQTTEATVRETSDRIFTEGDLDYVDEAYAEDVVMHHVPSGEDYEGREAFDGWIRQFRESFPDFERSVDDVGGGEEKFVTQ